MLTVTVTVTVTQAATVTAASPAEGWFTVPAATGGAGAGLSHESLAPPAACPMRFED